MYVTQQNQTLETNQLTNQTQNVINLNTPQTNQPNIVPNMYNNPAYNPTFNPQFNPQFNPNVNPVISPNINPTIVQKPTIEVKVDNAPKQIQVKSRRTLTGPLKLGIESKRMVCPFCEETIDTETDRSTNIKALLTAIGTCYCGFALIQKCKGKPVDCNDCEHSCPNCGHMIGKYYAM